MFGSGTRAAAFCMCLQVLTSFWTSSVLVKSLVVKFVNRWNRKLYTRWREVEGGWGARNIQAGWLWRLCHLSECDARMRRAEWGWLG